ncbi:MAG: winged helix-turn-helix transcriptional regulator [candidate division SR1 bacterium]|nr:winged helix-turn-helix transcriptional regulator [candidate division SR1 bacterium]
MKVNPNIQYPVPTDFAGFLLWQTANKWEKYINLQLKKTDLNQADMLHLISLFHLLQTSSEVSQVQLAEYTGVTTMSVSKILTKLSKIDLVTRKIGSDSRSKSISLTEKGIKILQECANKMQDADKKFFVPKAKPQFINYLNNL